MKSNPIAIEENTPVLPPLPWPEMQQPRRQAAGYGAASLHLEDGHLRRMVDDTGILQHARFSAPDPRGGYTTDDNARLMLAAAMYFEATGEAWYLDLCYKGLAFLQYAYKDGWFQGFMGYDRQFLERADSEDCFGRCVWCLGYVASSTKLPHSLRKAADALLDDCCASAERLSSLRSCAYTALGFALWGDHCRGQLAEHLARVAARFHENERPGWRWFEEEATTCNAVVPHALLAGYKVIGGERLLKAGLESLDFLLELTTKGGIFWPVGCHGWARRGSAPAEYDQQPAEACATLLCCLAAHEITGDEKYRDGARRCHDWFLGANSLGTPLIDRTGGGCYDALTADGPNLNQGAESLLSWYVSALAYRAHSDGRKRQAGSIR